MRWLDQREKDIRKFYRYHQIPIIEIEPFTFLPINKYKSISLIALSVVHNENFWNFIKAIFEKKKKYFKMLTISLLPHAVNQYAFIKITPLELYAFSSSLPTILTE